MTHMASLLPLQGRKAILEVHSRNKKVATDVDMFAVAQATAGYTGAELMNLMNKAAILAVRQGREVIKAIDIYEVGMRDDCSLRSFSSLTDGLAGSLCWSQQGTPRFCCASGGGFCAAKPLAALCTGCWCSISCQAWQTGGCLSQWQCDAVLVWRNRGEPRKRNYCA